MESWDLRGFLRSILEIFALLGCYAAYIVSWLPDVSGQPIGPFCKSRIAFWSLKIGTIRSPETSVTITNLRHVIFQEGKDLEWEVLVYNQNSLTVNWEQM
jgi:hypothetical protein